MASAHSSSGMTGISVMGKRVGSPSKYVPHDRTETSCGIDMPASCNAISTWLRTLAFAWLMMAVGRSGCAKTVLTKCCASKLSAS